MFISPRSCYMLLLLLGVLSVQAQEVSAPGPFDFPYPPNVKSVRIYDLQFSIDKETDVDDPDWEEDADTRFDNDDDTIYKDVGDYIREREADTLYDPWLMSQFTIDEKGNKTSYMTDRDYPFDTSWTDVDGTHHRESYGSGSSEKIATRYNKDGTVKNELFDSDRYGKRLSEYTYDRHRRLIKMEKTAPEFREITRWTYDKKGRLVHYADSTKRSGEEMIMSVSRSYEYNKNDQLTRSIRVLPAAATESYVDYIDTTTYEYDAQGRISRTIVNGSPNRKCRTFVYSYNEQGLIVRIDYEYKERYTSVITGEIIFEYDDHNLCTHRVETSHIGKGAGPYNYDDHWVTTYDDKGLPVRCVYTHKEHSKEKVRIFTWEYEYR